jgi:hypothetical protein
VVGTAGKIVDAHGNTWSITSGGQVAVNGKVDTTTANVIELAYEKGVVWQENTSKLWWSKTLPTDAWGPAMGTSTSPVPTATPAPTPAPTPKPTPVPTPAPTSKDNTVVLGTAGKIVDAHGNTWTITAGGQVAVNGKVDTTTANVTELAYEKGLVWQENTAKLWWSKALPTDAWGPAMGTSTSPVPTTAPTVMAAAMAPVTTTPASITLTPPTGAAQTIDGNTAATVSLRTDTFSLLGNGVARIAMGSGNDSLKFVGMSNVTLTNRTGNVTVTADGGSNTFVAGKGALEVTGGAGADSYVVKAGSGALTIDDFSAAKGDTLTLGANLKAAMHVGSDGHGGTAISFGTGTGTIDLRNVASVPTAAIHFS